MTIRVVVPNRPIDDVRRDAEDARAAELAKPNSPWGRKLIEGAGDDAVRREYERRMRDRSSTENDANG